ncbi:symporter small accessory protein [Thioalkalicoccus limnaeus]|uniref:Symporter small accessory protein n=1 Tax=Thioalkalicoccus limnaeus TaxID=120681 RepID=A0ABV4BFK5_9GAMM
MFGIDDPWVLLAYLGCFVMTAVSLVYGLIRRNAAPDELTVEDRVWALEEKRIEDER